MAEKRDALFPGRIPAANGPSSLPLHIPDPDRERLTRSSPPRSVNAGPSRSVLTFTGCIWWVGAILIGGVIPVLAQPEEGAVRQVVEGVLKALNASELDVLLSHFAEDARIDSLAARAVVSKTQYREAMAQTFASGNVLRGR